MTVSLQSLGWVVLQKTGIKPCQEQPIREHLREGVGEFPERQLMEDLVAKDLKKPEEPPFLVYLLLPHQLLAQIVAQLRAARAKASCSARPIPSGAVEKKPCKSFETATTRSSRSRNLGLSRLGMPN
jgi:hypothetical protein